MKKVFCFCILSIVLFTYFQVAVGEEIFTIRNGVQFGMDITEVQAIEQKENQNTIRYSNFAYAEASAYTSSMMRNTPYTYNENTYIFTDVVAGQNCTVVYVFDYENKLSSLRYVCEYNNALSSNLTDALVAKYSSPQYSESKMPLETKCTFYYDLCCMAYNSCNQNSYSGWLIPYSNTYVAIEVICFSLIDSACYECVTYTPISISEYNTVINGMQSSISNDL